MYVLHRNLLIYIKLSISDCFIREYIKHVFIICQQIFENAQISALILLTLYPIGRPVRATITLYPIGRPVRATITLYPIGRPVRATITQYPIGRPVRATITLYPIGRPARVLYPIGRPVRATITVSYRETC